jgi:hypothetical protein
MMTDLEILERIANYGEGFDDSVWLSQVVGERFKQKDRETTNIGKFLEAIEIVDHDSETIRLEMPLHVWDSFIGGTNNDQ